jgi:hypothetical protein
MPAYYYNYEDKNLKTKVYNLQQKEKLRALSYSTNETRNIKLKPKNPLPALPK